MRLCIDYLFLPKIGNNMNSPDLAIPTQNKYLVDLRKSEGSSFVEVMMNPDQGIYSKIIALSKEQVCINDAKNVLSIIKQRAPSDAEHAFSFFKNGETDAMIVAQSIENKKMTPDQLRTSVFKYISPDHINNPQSAHLAGVILGDLLILGSGISNAVLLDEKNYFYNVVYTPPIVQSGRTYAKPNNREVLDPSDPHFLNELKNMPTDNLTNMYQATLKVILNCDTSGVEDSYNPLITDFISIYTAELIRGVMVNFKTDPWAEDIAQVLFLASYVNNSKMLFKNGQFIEGTVDNFYAVGKKGSGIGDTRHDFHQLSQYLTSYMQKNHRKLTDQLTNMMDATGLSSNGYQLDLIRKGTQFITKPHNIPALKHYKKDFNKCFQEFLAITSQENYDITQYIQKSFVPARRL